MPVNPYCFVVGCVRSGTTLLQRMLDSHPQLAVGYDCHFIPQAIRRLDTGVDPPMTRELLDEVRSFPRFARLGLPEAAVERAAAGARRYSEFVGAVYAAFGAMHRKALAGEKAPGYVRHMEQLHALFPRARFIHLIRDGRDVALSVRDWGKGPARLELAREEPIATTALWWRRDILAGRRGGELVGPQRYMEVRYEALVRDPESALRALADFLDLPFDDRMVNYHEGRADPRPGRSAKAAWLAPTSGLRDWRGQMSRGDLERFEALAGDVRDMLGYEPGPVPGPDAQAAAARCRGWWEREYGPQESSAEPAAPPSTAGRRRRAHNPSFFIVGCPRSGTTLLKRMVDAHPQLAVTPETHWVPRFPRKGLGIDAEGMVRRDLVESLLAYRKFANLRIGRPELDRIAPPGRAVSYADFVSGVFDLYAAHAGKPLAGDKTPGYVQDLPLLHELWPRARFVHLIRDGRDVCLSVLQWSRAGKTTGRFATWAEDPLTTAALWWERFVRLGREAGTALGPRLYLELRYERLVAAPEASSAELCAFLDVPCDGAMVRFHEGRTRLDPGLSAKKAWRPVTAGIRDWRTQMEPADVERFEAAAGGLLDELGYPRAFPRPSARAMEHAARMRGAFTADPRLRRRRLPEAWMAAAALR
jgi:hypothetical protein